MEDHCFGERRDPLHGVSQLEGYSSYAVWLTYVDSASHVTVSILLSWVLAEPRSKAHRFICVFNKRQCANLGAKPLQTYQCRH